MIRHGRMRTGSIIDTARVGSSKERQRRGCSHPHEVQGRPLVRSFVFAGHRTQWAAALPAQRHRRLQPGMPGARTPASSGTTGVSLARL